MKINQININAFGNIEKKEIQLGDHINIIQGKNESGKSTLLKFISNMLYGISKNKKGRDYSDYERYKPWHTEEFSGKIKYTLENKQTYEVYRDFHKKNPLIYNESLEEISKQYTVDKTNGNQFFTEQTNIDEKTFQSTFISLQQEVILEQATQNEMIQKIANLAGTGNDTVSYQKAIDKINKKQIEEIGTNRTQDRPLNRLEKEIEELEKQKSDIVCFKDKKEELKKQKEEIKREIQKQEEKIEIIKQIKKIKEKETIEQEKIKLNQKMTQEKEETINQLKEEQEKNKIEKEKIKNKNEKIKNKKIIVICFICFIIGIIFLPINYFLLKNNLFYGISLLLFVLGIVVFSINQRKLEKRIENRKKEEIQKIEKELEKINTQINWFEKNKKDQEEEIQKMQNKLNLETNLEKEKLKNKYAEKINEFFSKNEIEEKQELIQEQLNKKQLQLKTYELEEKNMNPQIEKLASLEEEIESKKEQKEILLKDNQSFELAKEIMETAYRHMKENVTPRFTETLSNTIQKIANQKYQKVRVNDTEGLLVENEKGEYINANRLSVGTIDQLYLSLRLAIIKEVSQEPMPILLDEAFAYYDTERLTNLLLFLQEQCPNNQILLFTCTDREKEILSKQGIPYKLTIL